MMCVCVTMGTGRHDSGCIGGESGRGKCVHMSAMTICCLGSGCSRGGSQQVKRAVLGRLALSLVLFLPALRQVGGSPLRRE